MDAGNGRDVFDRIPKVELHCHVEGTVRPSTVVELARASGRTLPVSDPEALYRYDSLDSFLAVFWLRLPLLGILAVLAPISIAFGWMSLRRELRSKSDGASS